jgi:amino acid permease
MKDTFKKAKVIAWITIIGYSYSIISWIGLLIEHTRFDEHLSSMNNRGILFTHQLLVVNSIGIIVIQSLCVIGAFLVLNNKEFGRKFFIASFLLWPIHNVIWLVFNLLQSRRIGLFVINILIGVIFSIIVYRVFTRASMKSNFT